MRTKLFVLKFGTSFGIGNLMRIVTNVAYLQAYGCKLCIHIGSIAFLFGKKEKGRGPRIEICTPFHWFRYSRGYTE